MTAKKIHLRRPILNNHHIFKSSNSHRILRTVEKREEKEKDKRVHSDSLDKLDIISSPGSLGVKIQSCRRFDPRQSLVKHLCQVMGKNILFFKY